MNFSYQNMTQYVVTKIAILALNLYNYWSQGSSNNSKFVIVFGYLVIGQFPFNGNKNSHEEMRTSLVPFKQCPVCLFTWTTLKTHPGTKFVPDLGFFFFLQCTLNKFLSLSLPSLLTGCFCNVLMCTNRLIYSF